MNKKFLMVLMLLIIVVAGCGGEDSISGAEPSEITNKEGNEAIQEKGNSGGTTPEDKNSSAKDVSVVISPPDGWERVDSLGFLVHYKNSGASFMVKEEPYSGKTLDDVVQQAKEIFEKSFDKVQFPDDVEDLIVDNKNAKKVIFSCEVFDIQMMYQYIFLFIEKDVYVITFGSTAENYETFDSDFKMILDEIRFE